MEKPTRRRILGLVGITALAGCQTTAKRGSTPTDEQDERGPELGAIGKGGTHCLADSKDVHSGWVHTVAHGQTYDLTFDVRVGHREGVEVDVGLTEHVPGEYVLAFTAPSSTDGDTPEDAGCVLGSRIEGTGRLPIDFEKLRITMNGERLETLERKGEFGDLQPLPDPIQP